MNDKNHSHDNAVKSHNQLGDIVDNVKKAVEEKLHLDVVHELEKANKAADEARKQANKQASRFLPGLEIC